jgi:CHAT domain-containing protein/Flp pilus assembly protein TadD
MKEPCLLLEHISRQQFCGVFFRRLFNLCLISFWVLLLPASPIAAQTEAAAKFAEAEKLYSEAEELYRQGTKESLEEAIRKYMLASPLYHALGKTSDEAVTLSNIGAVYDNLGERQKALDFYTQALPLIRAAGDRSGEALTLKHIGAMYSALGEKQKALDYYFQALPLKRALGDRNGEGATLNNIGRAYDDLGEKQKALDYYAQALPLAREAGDRSGEATIINNIGLVYDDLGEKQKALDYYAHALPLFHANGDRGGEAMALGNIGAAYAALGEKQKALDYYTQALPLVCAVGDRSGEAAMLNNIGLAYNDLGEKQKALEYFGQSMPLYRANGFRKGEATALNNLGLVYNDLGEKQKALDYFGQALPLYRAVGERSGEALTLYNLSQLERARANLSVALTDIAAAIDIVESLRTKIGSQELRSSYFATVQNYYELYIELLMQLHKQKPTEGFEGRALQVSERGRARSLLETLAEANADIRQGVDPQLLARERALQQQLNARAQEQLQLLSGNHTDAQASAVAKELDALTGEYQQAEVQIRQSSPHYAALTQPQPLSLKEIQTQVLDKDTLLLQYSLGTERSYLWAVTQDSINSYELPKRAAIEDTARAVYALLTDASQWPDDSSANPSRQSMDKSLFNAPNTPASPEMLARLSQMILAPVAAQLGKKRLVVVADGALQFIPFAALPIPDDSRQAANSEQRTANVYRPLVNEHEIISLPSASTLAVLRQEVKDRQPAPKTLVVLADPVFERTDPRLKSGEGKEEMKGKQETSPTSVTAEKAGAMTAEKAGAALPSVDGQRKLQLVLSKSAKDSGVTGADLEIPRLPGTRKEAEQILALVPAASSKQAFDFMVSRATVTSEELSQYRYVHFATHGFLDSQHPELSGILLSMFDEHGQPQDGFLRAHEVFNLKLPAELVVLSACQTGLGKEIKGEGLVGLTRGFMYAGAPRVLVSLWSVSDVGTAELMTRFYREMLNDGKRPAEALQAAQVSMLKEKRFAAPYFWAAFTLQGEWR